MILEEITGDVVVTVMKSSGQKAVVVVGEYISDHESSTICVTGVGKATVRVDPSCTFDIKGVTEEAETSTTLAPAPEPVVEAAPVAELVPTPVETPSETAKETAKK